MATGGSKKKTEQGPPINAQSPDEEKFIKYVTSSLCAWSKKPVFLNDSDLCRDWLASADQGEKKEAKAH
jgi:hypothetical protein